MKTRHYKFNPARGWIPCAAIAMCCSFSLAGATFSDDNWSPLGSGLNGRVYALAISGSNVYAGGKFTMAGGSPASFIAKWDGTQWSALGSGVNSYVRALAVHGTDLYAAGYFTRAGGITVSNIAKWNGSSWSSLGRIGGYNVDALVFSGTNLYAGGSIGTADFFPAHNIAKWNGSYWSTLGSGVDSPVHSLAVMGNKLVVGAENYISGPYYIGTSIAQYDGLYWSGLGTGMSGASLNAVYALAVSGTNLYAGGLFVSAGGVGTGSIARWNGSAWSFVGVLNVNSNYYPSVMALASSGTDVYVGGDFTKAGGVTVNRIVRWNGSSWSSLGSGMDTNVWALAASGGDLYAGGDFTTAGGKAAAYIAHASLPLPVVSITRSGGQVTISWPSDNGGFNLERAAEAAPSANWIANTAGIFDDGTTKSVIVSVTNSSQFFRLRRQ